MGEGRAYFYRYMETLPKRFEARRSKAGRPPTVITEKQRGDILDTYSELHNYKKVARELDLPMWTVWKVLADQPPNFRFNILQGHTYETIHAALNTIARLLPEVKPREVADLHRMIVGLAKALTELEVGGAVRGPKNAMQTIINIGGEEAARLKQTMIEGEVVDHSNP